MKANPSQSEEARGARLRLALVALHAALVVPLAFALNVWSDEASTLYSTAGGLAATWRAVFTDEKQAPLYFLLLSLWREIDGSIFFARLFSIVFGLLAIWTFAALARRFFAPRAAALLAAFFALHPFLIWASLEIRVYSTVVFLACLLLRLFVDGYLSDDGDAARRRRARALYVAAAVAALYANYYLGFLLAGNFAALLAMRRWRAARACALDMTLAGVAILPLLLMIRAQLAAAAGDVREPRELAEGVRLVWNAALNFVLPTELFPPEEATRISFARVWLVRLALAAFALLLVKRRRVADPHALAFGACAATVALFLLAAYFLLGEIYVEIRHAAVLFPPLVLCAALAVREAFAGGRKENAPPDLPPAAALALAAAFAALFAYSVYALYPAGAKRGDWIRVARYLEARERPNQPIVVFTVFDALNLPYHYRGVNRVLPDERFFNWGVEGAFGTPESIRAECEFAISKFPPAAEEVWLATGERCQTTKACAPLENFVAANYTVIEERDFYKEKLRLLRKRK